MEEKNIKEKSKKILIEFKQLYIRKKQLLNIINNLEKEIQTAKSPSMSLNSFAGNNTTMSAKIAKLVDYKQQYDDIIELMNNKLWKIEKVLLLICEQNPVGANVLHYHFVEQLSFEKIACKINFSYRQTLRYYNNALQNFYNIYNKEYEQHE